MTPTKVLCPKCDGEMVQRKGPNGPFYGCRNFPNCRGTRNILPGEAVPTSAPPAPKSNPYGPLPKVPVDHAPWTGGGVKKFADKDPDSKPKYEPMVVMPGSAEQEAIWKEMLQGSSHVVINAGPGVGKTHSMVQFCLRAPKTQKILFVAFNKHIAAEANGKLSASGCYNVRACTQHSLGYSILRQNFKTLGNPNESKMQDIFESLCPMPPFGKAAWRRKLNLAEKLSSFVKNYLLDYRAAGFREEMERLADHHGLEMNGHFNDACDLVAPALDECKKLASVSVDFGDMVWLPVVLNLPVTESPDMLICDEAQDLAPNQHALTLMACPKGRIVIVGDRRQAIYSWRGASVTSIEDLAKQLGASSRGVKEFPLTITRRCPKAHVAMAQNLFPDIQALPDAPEGEIFSMTRDAATNEMKPNDLVICRVNKELISTAYALIRRGVRPSVKGRDIGKGLLQLIATLEKDCAPSTPDPNDPERESEMHQLRGALSRYRFEQESKLSVLGAKAEGRIASLQDKCDCLLEFIANSKTVEEMVAQIESIFSDSESNNAVVLGTIHRTKGLESHRVFILAPELIPHPMAKKPHEIEGERNAAWIACTRAKFDKEHPGTLIFCGPIPSIFGKQKKKPATIIHQMGPALERELDRQEVKHNPLDNEEDQDD